MSADGIEVPQRYYTELRVCHANIPQHLLDHHLGITIGIGGRGGHILLIGHGVVAAVYRCAGRKDHRPAAILPHHPQEGQRTADVVVVVLQRLLY